MSRETMSREAMSGEAMSGEEETMRGRKKSESYAEKGWERWKGMNEYLWSEELGSWGDYDMVSGEVRKGSIIFFFFFFFKLFDVWLWMFCEVNCSW